MQKRLADRAFSDVQVAACLGDTAQTVAKVYRNVLVDSLDRISDSLREGVQ